MPRYCLAVLAFGLCASPMLAEDWPQWRGAKRDNVWREKGLPEQIHLDRPAPRWKQAIGGGYGGIAVAGGRVYAMDYQKMEYGNGPRSTPTVHAGRVYTFGARGHLNCLDAATGEVVWSRDTVREL